ncbi:MAG: hypothetical protein PHI59_03020 [Candidatus Omnitrophica bacterium]|nr:hypothetical protein [Candidatus Omnitrophota bacterium]
MKKMKSVIFKELPVHDTCWSITTGRDGNIYVGVCGELTGGLSVFIVRYDPVKETTDYLLEVGPTLSEPSDNSRAPISKIHYCLLPGSGGKLYCATHYSGPPLGHPIWRPWHTWDDPEYMASGFHIFTFDPKNERVEDFGVMSPNEGSRAMALAEKRGFLYGITWPRNHFYVFDIRNRKYKDIGRIGDINPQVIWVDLEENGYTVDDLGCVVKYDADAARLVNLNVKVPKDPQVLSEARSVYDAIPSPDGRSIYGVTWNLETVLFAERLFRFDSEECRIYDLGPARGKEKLDHVGGLIFGDDGYLYYAVSKKDKKRRLSYRMYLYRMDVDTLKKEEICPFDDGAWHSEYIAKATKDFAGNLYFADTNNRPERIYVYTPEGYGKDFKPRWPLVRSWG